MKVASKYCNRCGCKMEEHELFSSRYWRCMVCEPSVSTDKSPEVEEDEEKTPEIWAPLFDLFNDKVIERFGGPGNNWKSYDTSRATWDVTDNEPHTDILVIDRPHGVTYYDINLVNDAWDAWQRSKLSVSAPVYNGIFTL